MQTGPMGVKRKWNFWCVYPVFFCVEKAWMNICETDDVFWFRDVFDYKYTLPGVKIKAFPPELFKLWIQKKNTQKLRISGVTELKMFEPPHTYYFRKALWFGHSGDSGQLPNCYFAAKWQFLQLFLICVDCKGYS